MFPFQRLIYQVRLTWRLLQDARVPIWKKVIPFFGFAYVILPIDFIPDFLVVVGQLDDLGVVILSMQLFERSVDPAIVEDHRAALEGRAPEEVVISPSDYKISYPERKAERNGKK
ncbi:MAG TPA: YkvA family protein [Phototrophicaceae bacterium]|jgi:uncharacterized membrane protein YkvA (DUF1232 family)|nr:YkvA family protein [Phototrophicaceae bacterium]